MTSRMKRWLALALAAAAAQPACAATAPRPQVAIHVGAITTARLERLARFDTVTRGDCVAAVASLVYGRTLPGDDRLGADLQRRGVLKPADLERLDRPATRGYACLLFKRAIGEHGGVIARLLRDNEHYAYRHLEYLDLVPEGGSWVSMTGPELISLLTLSKRHRRGARGEVSAR